MDQTAIITGGAKRIGAMVTSTLAELGYHVALIYLRSGNEAVSVRDSIEKTTHISCRLFQVDLRDTKASEQVINQIFRDMARPTLLVNNAAVFHPRKLRNLTPEPFEGDWQINFRAAVFLTQKFASLADMGQVINLLDGNVTKNETEYFDYLLAKKALLAFTEMAALELAPQFRINAISLGPFLPPESIADGASFMRQRVQDLPLKRQGSAAHLSSAIRFLVQNDFVTGQNIYLDGGLHL